jgi:hypothetical protein
MRGGRLTVASKSGSFGDVIEWRSGAIADGATSMGVLAPAIDRRGRGMVRAGTPEAAASSAQVNLPRPRRS